MQCHKVDYEILGSDMQIVEVELDPGETVVAEAGAMNYMGEGITFEAKMGDGSNPDDGIMGKLLGAGKRVLTGESIFLTHFTNTGSGFFGGEGFILQKLEGDGMAFAHAGGTVVSKELDEEVIRVDTGCIVGFTGGIDYSIERAGNLKSMFFGGEGLFLATLRGKGIIYLQSLPFSRMCDRILAHAPSAGGSRKGEGSVLGGLGNLIGGK